MEHMKLRGTGPGAVSAIDKQAARVTRLAMVGTIMSGLVSLAVVGGLGWIVYSICEKQGWI